MIVCPSCNGTKEGGLGFVTRASGCSVEALPCSTCGGTGEVPADYAERAAAGRRLREERIAAGVSLGDLARAAGERPSEVSDAERGRRSIEEVDALRSILPASPEPAA